MKNFIKGNWFKFIFIICAVAITVGWFYFPKIAEARSGCCSWHGGVCGCSCCDGTPLSATCAPYYPGCSRSYTPSYPSYTTPSIPSCPLNSHYDLISQGCKCNYGYVVGKDFLGKESCISGNSYCWDKYGYNSSYSSLNKICECSYGYLMSGGKCISEDDYCENLYGWHTRYNSLYDKCECDYGYIFNKDLFGDFECIDGDTYCHDLYGYHSSFDNLSEECECDYDYIFDGQECSKEKNSYSIIDYNYLLDTYSQKTVCPDNSTKKSDDKCYCNDDYQINNNKDGCIQKVTVKGYQSPLIDSNVEENTIKEEKKLVVSVDSNLSNRLKGRIILQVENHGEAWYINPKNNKKYYMANGERAYNIMRYLGVGITNKDLDKINADKSFAKKHSGKIFLQVEKHGEAWYIDVDGNAHYLKDGNKAYTLMRELGLGVTNNDLRKIEVGEVE